MNLQEIIKTFPMLFDDRLRLVCRANMQQASLAICRDSNDGSLWILNDEVQNCELKARELFGFNIGSSQELPTGDLCTICFPTQKNVSQFSMAMHYWFSLPHFSSGIPGSH